ncbi:PREDICTED: poly(U)-specific endoribonuclease homolog [Vollenhovia emeryi]|uniref:poly(U)-specific endoribonuclease homolog n=1 Tax=Vollenhovia emeryi TaxID=411798 RepID=UPI0005F3DF76|nr:PREDICTED: poly(U)-specific endoribonuclease homolog [Vollenhovia emeryi]
MTNMIVKHFFLVLAITLLLYVGNSEAGWKFWKKEETTTTTTTTTTTIPSVQSVTPTKATIIGGPTVPAINPANSGPTIGQNGAQQNVGNNARPSARPNRPNPGTEVGLDIVAPKPNRPGIGGGNGQTYRDWAVDFAGAGEPARNQPSRTPGQGLATNGGQTRPSSPTDSRPTSVSGNIPIQPTQPSVAGSRNTPQPLPQSTSTVPKPTSVQSVHPYITPGSTTATPPARIDQNNPNRPSSGQTWANVVAGGAHGPVSPTSSPRQPGYPGENERRTMPGAPIRPDQSPQPNRPASPGAAATGSAAAAAGATAITGRVSDSTGKVYSSNPTYSKGNTITDEDLEKLSEALYIKETNNNANQYVTVNLQKQTTGSSPTDQAPQPLLTVNPAAFQIPTIQRVLSIFDNYQLDTHTNEYISPAQREEESLLVDTFLSTNVMSAAMRFLADKGFVRKDYYEYKDMLRRIWFNLFSRGQGKLCCTGFEHVFMAETKQVDSGTEVLGLHNWIFFNAEETKRHIDYLGYIKKTDLGSKGSIVKMHAKFNGYDKPIVSVFIGTSPELEMALYTVCFYARPDGNCPVSLGGTKFNIITHKFRYRGKDLIGTAYPDI